MTAPARNPFEESARTSNVSTEALPGLSLRVAACRYAAIVADSRSSHAQRVKAWDDLERAAIEHAGRAIAQELVQRTAGAAK